MHRAVGAAGNEICLEFGREQSLFTDGIERTIENAIADGGVLHQLTRDAALGQCGGNLARLTQRQLG